VSNLLKILPVVNSKLGVRWALWLYGFMALWLYGFMALWLYGFMALWLYGFMETSGRYFIVIQTKKNAIQKKIGFLSKIGRNTLWRKNSSYLYAFNSVKNSN